MQKLRCKVQNYEWGKLGNESIVAKLISKQMGNIEKSKPYAEFWMGIHPNGPSVVLNNEQILSEYIKERPEVVAEHEKKSIKYLFKILSVNKALSIQIHPDKNQAKILHSNNPKNYPDENHKPELAIALTNFEVLCGFRVSDDIIYNIKTYPALTDLIHITDLETLSNEQLEYKKNEALKRIFVSIWNSSPLKISFVIQTIIKKILQTENLTSLEKIVLRLYSQYSDKDVGVLAPFLLNYFTLKPGESIFIGPNIPHAYLYGDCVECMACSDNTIRAGLTPKFIDIENLCNNTLYKMIPPPYFVGKTIANGIIEYAPPVDEFVVHKINNEASEIDNIKSSSIIIVINGITTIEYNNSTITAEFGDVVFLPYFLNTKLKFINSSQNFLCFRAFTPI